MKAINIRRKTINKEYVLAVRYFISLHCSSTHSFASMAFNTIYNLIYFYKYNIYLPDPRHPNTGCEHPMWWLNPLYYNTFP